MKKLGLIVIPLLFLFFGKTYGQTTINMQREGGVFSVPCEINGLKLKFIFDTGASDVSISLTEAMFMLKNGYLKSEDVLNKQYFTDAKGSISVGTKIILRRIDFAGLTLYDVEASVTHELAAPLLFGQSVMMKLGKFEFDPNNGTLTILAGPRNNSTTTINTSISGTVKVTADAPIYDQPSSVGCRQVGRAKEGWVKIVRKENDSFYYVTVGGVSGYLWVGWLKR